jgi:hypothetical protein
MCDECVGILANNDRIFAAYQKAVKEGMRWAMGDLLKGEDPVLVWMDLGKRMTSYEHCNRENMAYLLAAVYVKWAQMELPGVMPAEEKP